MHQFEYKIEESQIESGYGHLHHADALKLLEKARLDLLVAIGFPNQHLIEQGLLLVITNIEVIYKRELFAGPIEVNCSDFKIDARKILMKQQILNHKGKVAVEGLVGSCFMSAAARRSLEVSDGFRMALLSC
jgi:YbgC/YbaW family acyl-CoA thioester hydrolase